MPFTAAWEKLPYGPTAGSLPMVYLGSAVAEWRAEPETLVLGAPFTLYINGSGFRDSDHLAVAARNSTCDSLDPGLPGRIVRMQGGTAVATLAPVPELGLHRICHRPCMTAAWLPLINVTIAPPQVRFGHWGLDGVGSVHREAEASSFLKGKTVP